MAILSSELLLFGSAGRPTDDESTSGGAIDTTARPVFAQIAATDNIEVVSDDNSDNTQTLTVTGRLASGQYVSEQIALTGTTQAVSTNQYERILSAVLDGDAAGTVTVRRATGDTLIGTIPPGEREFYATFIKSASDTNPVSRYEKVFAKNTNASLTLNDAKVTLTADPQSRIKIALAAAKDDSGDVADRLTSPGLSFSDDNVELSVPDDMLEADEAIGVWVEQALEAADAPFKSTYTLRLAGTSV